MNAVCPGFINTEMVANELSPEMLEKVKGAIPLGRLGETSEARRSAAFWRKRHSKFALKGEREREIGFFFKSLRAFEI